MDYTDFYNLLHVIASWRLHELPQFITSHMHEPHFSDIADDDSKSDFDCTDNHLVYDLFRLEKVLAEMTQPAMLDILDVSPDRLLSSPAHLHSQVERTLVKACKYLNCGI